MAIKNREGGDIGLFITLVPSLRTLGTYLDFDRLIQKGECPSVLITNCNLRKG